jgi:hypothetical protein
MKTRDFLMRKMFPFYKPKKVRNVKESTMKLIREKLKIKLLNL